MGAKVLEALLNILSKNPDLLEKFVEAGLQLAVSEMQKAVAKAQGK